MKGRTIIAMPGRFRRVVCRTAEGRFFARTVDGAQSDGEAVAVVRQSMETAISFSDHAPARVRPTVIGPRVKLTEAAQQCRPTAELCSRSERSASAIG